MTQLLLDIQPEQAPTLDNFVAGANGELVARLGALAHPGNFDILYVWGPMGSGKSHLLAAAALRAEARQPAHRPVIRLAGSDATESLSVPTGGLLVVDDVEALSGEAQVALFRIFNAARLIGLSLLLSGNEPPLRLALREDLRTRIGQSLAFEIRPLSDDEKSAALRRHALQRGMRMDEGLVRYLLSRGRRDLPSLMAVLDSLDRASLEQQRPATLPLLREVMQLPLDASRDEARTV
ncbi:MAG: DnaA regulatory inactivator Hda [Sulfurisoma sp.]|nr:DnaA regulatory inactivator Hda [Sulfurisoma sp.]